MRSSKPGKKATAATAKIISLHARPLQISHLAFEIGGILDTLSTKLGATLSTKPGGDAKPFPFTTFYGDLRTFPTVSGDLSRLLYNFSELLTYVDPSNLATLRAEPAKAALNKAINARQNAYFAKYADASDIAKRMVAFYSSSTVGSKWQRLQNLNFIADQQWMDLKKAYEDPKDPQMHVIRSTKSVLSSVTTSQGSSEESGQNDENALTVPVSHDDDATLGPPPSDGGSYTLKVSGIDVKDEFAHESFQEGTNSYHSNSMASAYQDQTIINTDYIYRHPYREAQAQYERAKISLMDQLSAQLMLCHQNIPNLTQVFQNELNSMDSDVYQLQIALLRSILMSPIPGIVTGIYKNPGDAVKAGEPVVRVENNDIVLLAATLIYRGPISIQSNVTVETKLFDSSGPPTTVKGSVVAARGQQADDRWDLVVKCDNLNKGGKHIFPLGYHFDYDDTNVMVG